MSSSFKRFFAGVNVVPKTPLDGDELGDLEVSSSTSQIYFNNGSSASAILTENHQATVTNKDLVDNSVNFVDNSDNTKKFQFEALGITAGQTRVYTVPDANTTLVGTALSQVLTNKTIDSDSNTLSNIKNADIKSAAAIARSKLAAGTANHVVINAADGSFSSEATLATSRGGLNIASYTTGDLVYASSSSVLSKLAIGSNGQVLKVASGLPSYGSGVSNLGYISKTASYVLTTNDDFVAFPTAGVTATLPTAVGNDGKRFWIKKTANDFNLVTLATTSSQSIDGVVGSNLATYNEVLEVVSDGANYQIIERRIPSFWTAYTPTYTGFGNVTTTSAFWKRDGDSIELDIKFTIDSPTGVEGRFGLPSGLTSADSTRIPSIRMCGDLLTSGVGAVSFYTLMEASVAYITYGVQGASQTGQTKLNGNALSGGVVVMITARVPITNWKG